MEGEVTKLVRKNNIVIIKNDFIIPRTCEYYLHFNVKLPFLHKEFLRKD